MHQEDLPGSRKAIAKAVEGRIAAVEAKVENVHRDLREFIGYVKTPRDRR
jgi:hypothetical protein